MKKEFGLIGLGVMGRSLSRNLADKGFRLSLYNRFVEGEEEQVAETFISEFPVLSGAGGFEDLQKFVESLAQPRKIFLMVKAGKPTIELIDSLIPFLAEGDIIIDGGNSHYKDTSALQKKLNGKGIHFIGCGISGGEEGALKGPSMMPGGDASAYKKISPYFEAVAAKDKEGNPCCSYVGEGGSGHFVKMVHNGIEYGEMQLLAEAFLVLKQLHGYNPDQVAEVFEYWNEGKLSGYLLEITSEILKRKEDEDWLIHKILDMAGNKGTGSWTSIAAAELGVPVPTITAALNARYISELKDERLQAESAWNFDDSLEKDLTIETLKQAYKLARVINHHQGFHLMQAASAEYGWELNLPEIARIWTNGCIIRSALMEQLIESLSGPKPVLLSPSFANTIKSAQPHLTELVTKSLSAGLDIPCFSASLNYLIGYSTGQSTANIIQAQRDYFGAHTYKRVDDPSGKSHHTNWND